MEQGSLPFCGAHVLAGGSSESAVLSILRKFIYWNLQQHGSLHHRFPTGFPGHESQHRSAMLKILGQEKHDLIFDKWLEYFFSEADAKYFANLGLHCIRIPFNYRHSKMI
jgi:hypothetical protein